MCFNGILLHKVPNSGMNHFVDQVALYKDNYKKDLIATEATTAKDIGTWELDLRSGDTLWSTQLYRFFDVDAGLRHNFENELSWYSAPYGESFETKILEATTLNILVEGRGVNAAYTLMEDIFFITKPNKRPVRRALERQHLGLLL